MQPPMTNPSPVGPSESANWGENGTNMPARTTYNAVIKPNGGTTGSHRYAMPARAVTHTTDNNTIRDVPCKLNPAIPVNEPAMTR